MSLWRIGDVAERLGLTVAAVRYYDDRGLVRASRRIAGARWYDADAVRRLAFLHLARQLDIPLEIARQVLDGPQSEWASSVRAELQRIESVIEVARGAHELLSNALECQHEHPAQQCPSMRAALDEMVDGASPAALPRISS